MKYARYRFIKPKVIISLVLFAQQLMIYHPRQRKVANLKLGSETRPCLFIVEKITDKSTIRMAEPFAVY